MPWVMWITGLPGSGKSTIAQRVKQFFPDAVILRMDELRKIVTPEPTYSETEREYVYKSMVFTAKTLYESGHDVIIDATANKKAWRELAREYIPEFFEVYLTCPMNICMEREKTRTDTHSAPDKIYEKGQRGWPVPGFQVPYEEPENPDIIIHTDQETPETSTEKILHMIRKHT
jgi:adenylylsulfate kinase